MRKLSMALIVALFLSLTIVPAVAQDATEEAVPESTESAESTQPVQATATSTPPPVQSAQTGRTHVVQRGETLNVIAQLYDTSATALAQLNGIVNPNLIYAGQVLRIPDASVATPTSDPAQPVTYRVQRGDTLFRIAVRNNTTVAELVRLNNLPNANFIYSGQVLIIREGAASGAPPVAAQPTATPSAVVVTEAAAEQTAVVGEITVEAQTAALHADFGYGVIAFLPGQDLEQIVSNIETLGVNWVKVLVNWRDLEQTEGEIVFDELDAAVDALDAAGVKILFSVSTAPDWARPGLLDEDGPPREFSLYTAFVSAVAERYAGVVDAYQIWNEPNLRREWNTIISYDENRNPTEIFFPISAATYMEMLRQAYNAIKAIDAEASVISAGLAPTGFNDGVNAINDRQFLREMYANGLALVSDGIGAHPGGWANPPAATCCSPAAPDITTHYQDRSFYFLDTLNDYRAIMLESGDASAAIWVTKFGWGSSADTAAITNERNVNIFVNYTDLDEQARYAFDAFSVGLSLGFVGPMFLDNLNGCAVFGADNPSCYNSLIAPNGELRPVFSAVESIAK